MLATLIITPLFADGSINGVCINFPLQAHRFGHLDFVHIFRWFSAGFGMSGIYKFLQLILASSSPTADLH
jgi:hypothetical protein